MTKIFITIPWFVPAFRAGGPIQSVANLVKEYTDAEYYIFCSDTDLNGSALENITTGKWMPFNDHTKVWYSQHEKISESLVKQVEAIKPAVIYIIGVFSWHFNMVPLLYCKAPKKILSTRGMLHPGALSQKKWKKKIYLHVFKLLEYHHKIIFHATDEEEHGFIRNRFGAPAVIFTAGNFPNKISALPVTRKEPGSLQLVSVALISPMKNILMALTAMAKCKDTIDYNIYGAIKDHDYWAQCKEQIKKLPANITVTWHGETAPANVAEALGRSQVFILPSKSENFGHAIYEALSAGRPVITSHKTPWNDLYEHHAGINVSLDNETELTDAINFFAAMQMDEMQAWSNGAHEYAERAVNVDEVRKQYEEMFSFSPAPPGESLSRFAGRQG
jgi:glycosyltransferase involved in cell wall biosynthesis